MMTCSLLIYGMNQLPHVGWHDLTVLGPLGLFAVSLVLFIFVELRSPMPILSFALFKNRLFTASMFSLFFFITSTQSAISFLMPFYLQNILHYSPSQMGWIIVANSAVIVMIAPLAGWLSDRLGSRLLCTFGSIIIVIGQYFIASLGLDSSILRIVFPIALVGLGLGIFQLAQSECDLGLGAARQSRHGVGYEYDHGAHRRRHGRRPRGNSFYLRSDSGRTVKTKPSRRKVGVSRRRFSCSRSTTRCILLISSHCCRFSSRPSEVRDKSKPMNIKHAH